ncbi:MAG: phytoene desaturase [Phycisphaerae bacterium]|nr:phytoene desaturase [Phycisphaerae bacterium]
MIARSPSALPATVDAPQAPLESTAFRATTADANGAARGHGARHPSRREPRRNGGGGNGDGGRRRPTVAVIGAGPGGLSTALMLAHAGFAVTIFEARDRIGGRTRRIDLPSDVGTFALDCGPTFFMMPYVLEEILASTGRRLRDYCDLTRLDPMYRLVIGRTGSQAPLTIDATQDLERMAAQLSAIEPPDGPAFQRFIRDNRAKLRLMEPILRRPIRGWRDLLTLDGLKVAPALKPWQSLYQHLAGYFRNEHVRLALSFQSKYLGMSPFECPSLFSILPFIEYEYGIWHPQGGCNALMDALACAVCEEGATIRVSSPVERIAFEGRRASGVVVHGETHRFDHVVVNADAGWALTNLVPESLRGRWTDRTIASKRYSCSTFMLYLGVAGEVDLPHHTIYTSKDYRGNLANIATHGRLSADASTYVCNASRTDASLAPEGHSSLYVLVPTPNAQADIDWTTETPRLREDAYRQLETVFGIEDIRGRVVAERCVTPADWRGENIMFGATFNLAHSLPQMLHRRPQHRFEGLDGLWFVGGGTHPGSGLPVIFLSAEITTDLLCKEEGIPSPLSTLPFAAGAERVVPAATTSPEYAGQR